MRKLFLAAAAIALAIPALASAQDRGDRGDRGGRGRDGGQFQSQGGAPQAAPQASPPPAERGGGRSQGGFGNRGAFDGRGDPGFRAPRSDAPGPSGFQRSDRGGFGQGFQSGGQPGGQNRFEGRQGDSRADRGPDRGRDRGQGDRRFDNRGPDNQGFGDNRRFDNRGGRSFTDNRPFDRNFNDGRRFNDNRNYGRGGSYSYRGRSFDRFRAQPYRWPGGYRGAFNWRPRQILPSTFLLPNYFIGNYADFGFGAPPYGYEWIRVGDDALLVDVYTGEILEVAPGVFYW